MSSTISTHPPLCLLTVRSDPSGAEKREVISLPSHPKTLIADFRFQENETATAILKKKKKPNALMYGILRLMF
jgi:hypothetical protein